MPRTNLSEQAQHHLPSRDLRTVTGGDAHFTNEAHGYLEICIRFYSGLCACRLYPEVRNLDIVKQYVAEHNLNTRKKTPTQQFTRLAGQSALVAQRPLLSRAAPTPMTTKPAPPLTATAPPPSSPPLPASAASPQAHASGTFRRHPVLVALHILWREERKENGLCRDRTVPVAPSWVHLLHSSIPVSSSLH